MKLTIYPSRPIRTIPDTLFGGNVEWFNPVPHIDAPVSLVRFPGGTCSDSYHWQTPLSTPMRLYDNAHPEWKAYHTFNSDSLKALGVPMLLTVNVRSTPEEAAAWVAHHPEVTYWEVGNEVYSRGDYSGTQTTDEHITQFKAISKAMRAVNPTIKLIAIGGMQQYTGMDCPPDWIHRVSHETDLDYIALHTYNLTSPAYLEAVKAIIPPRVNIAITEWGPLKRLDANNCNTIRAAFEVADTFRIFLREPRVKIATFFKMTGDQVCSWYKSDGTPEPTTMALLFHSLMGRALVESELTRSFVERLAFTVSQVVATTTGFVALNRSDKPIPLTVAGIKPTNYLSLTADSLDSTQVRVVEHDGKSLPARSITLARVA